MIILVCGGRNWDDQDAMNAALDRIHAETPVTLLIEGGQATRDKASARIWGADWQAQTWAISRNVPHRNYWAQWHDERGNLDRSAGPKRNQRMIDEGRPALVVAFPLGLIHPFIINGLRWQTRPFSPAHNRRVSAEWQTRAR